MDYSRRNITRDFIFYLRLCKDPMRVFPLNSIFCTKANDWLYHLVDYECQTLKEKQLRNQYLARLVACLDAKVLVAPFLDPAIGKLDELRGHTNCGMDDPCDEAIFCDRHRNYLLNREKREELDAALHRLEVKRNNSYSMLSINDPESCCEQSVAIKDQTITQLRSIEMTLSDLTMKTKLLTNSIEPDVSGMDTGRRTMSLRRSRSDLTKRDVTTYQTLCGQTDETPRCPYMHDCSELMQRHASTQRSLSPYTKEFIAKYKLNDAIQNDLQAAAKRSLKNKDGKRRSSALETGSSETQPKHAELVAHCGRESGVVTKHACSKHSEHKSSRHSKADKTQEHSSKRNKSPKTKHERHHHSTHKEKPWFLDTDRSTLKEQSSTARSGQCSRAVSCHRCQGSIAIPQEYNVRPAAHFNGEPLPLPATGHAFGDGFPTVPPFPHSISELSSTCSELPDTTINSIDYKDFNQEMEEFQQQHFYGEPTITFAVELDDSNAMSQRMEQPELKQTDNYSISQTLDKLTLMCQDCVKEKEILGKLKLGELSPLPNLEVVLPNSPKSGSKAKYKCSCCLKSNTMSSLYFKKKELHVGKFSKFTLPAPRTSPVTVAAKVNPNPVELQEKIVIPEKPPEQLPPRVEPEPTPLPTPEVPKVEKVVENTAAGQPPESDAPAPEESAKKPDNVVLNITKDEGRRIRYLLRCIANERSGAVKPGSNNFLERNVNRFLNFISQFDDKCQLINKSLSESQVRQNVIDLMAMDLQTILQQQEAQRLSGQVAR